MIRLDLPVCKLTIVLHFSDKTTFLIKQKQNVFFCTRKAKSFPFTASRFKVLKGEVGPLRNQIKN